jgi:hypothetical protein
VRDLFLDERISGRIFDIVYEGVDEFSCSEQVLFSAFKNAVINFGDFLKTGNSFLAELLSVFDGRLCTMNLVNTL